MSSIVHSARPPIASRISLTNRGRTGAAHWSATVSSERKENLLQPRRRILDPRTQLVERSHPPHGPIGEQHKAIANTFGVGQLVDGENQCASHRCGIAQDGNDLANLL